MAEIPEKYIEFCKEVAKLARQNGVNKCTVAIFPAFDDKWQGCVNVDWRQGRHGEQAGNLHITSTLEIHTKLDA